MVRCFICPILYLKKGPWNSHNCILVAVPPDNGNTALGISIHPPNIKWDIRAGKDNTPTRTEESASPLATERAFP